MKRRKLGQWGLAYAAGAWVAMQVMEVVADPLGLSSTFQLGILTVLLLGLPFVLVLAWYHGERGKQRITGVELAILAALLTVGGLAVRYAGGRAAAPAMDRGAITVAVLPPVNIGPDPGTDYFAEAVAEELRDRLSHIVPVKSRQSVARFADTDQDVSGIAAELGVTHLLEVSVRKDGRRARVSVQLTEASSGFGAWSEVFEGESEDWFALHEEMAVRFAEALDLYLTPEETEAVRTRHTESPLAYDEYWRGWELLESFHANVDHPPEEYAEAEAHFRRALEEDPQYALAIAGLSTAYSYAFFYGVDRSEGRRERAEELARQALNLDPALPEAHAALGLARNVHGDHDRAIQSFREALRLDEGNAVVWCLLAAVCNARGTPTDLAEAVEAAREAIRIDPGWFYSYQLLGSALERLGRYEEAANAYQGGIRVNPAGRANHYGLGRVHLELGNHREALDALEEARRLQESGTLLLYVGAAHAGLGNTDEALEAIDRGLSLGGGGGALPTVDAVRTSPYFVALREDPRFRTLLERYGGG